jgi:hypothetical protein
MQLCPTRARQAPCPGTNLLHKEKKKKREQSTSEGGGGGGGFKKKKNCARVQTMLRTGQDDDGLPGLGALLSLHQSGYHSKYQYSKPLLAPIHSMMSSGLKVAISRLPMTATTRSSRAAQGRVQDHMIPTMKSEMQMVPNATPRKMVK